MKNLFTRVILMAVISITVFSTAQAQYEVLWERNDRTGALAAKPSWMTAAGAERGIAYGVVGGNERVYVMSRSGGNNIRAIDPATGADVTLGTPFTFTGVSGGTFVLNDIEISDDGVVFAANMALGTAASPFKVYVWTSEGGNPVHTYSFTGSASTSGGQRMGDKITVKGSWADGTLEIWTALASTTPGIIYVHKTSDQGATWTVTTITLSGSSTALVGNPDVEPTALGGSSDFYVSYNGAAPRRHSSAGVFVAGSAVGSTGSHNGMSYISNSSGNFLAAYMYRVADADVILRGYVNVYNLATPGTILSSSPRLRDNTTLGNAINGDVAVKKNSDGSFVVFGLGTDQGLIAYNMQKAVTVTGDAGWRMMAAPINNFPVTAITAQTGIQGFASDGFNRNFFTGYNGSIWTPDASNNSTAMPTTVSSGRGFLLYFFNNANAGSKAIGDGLTFNAYGTEPTSDVSVAVHADGNRLNLLGNPYATAITASSLTSDGSFTGTVLVWQDGTGTGDTGSWLASSDMLTLNGKIGAWQGFILENTDATSITIPTSAKTTGGQFYRNAADDLTQLQFRLFEANGETPVLHDQAAIVQFRADGTDAWDRHDLTKMASLNASSALLYFVGDRDGVSMAKTQESRPNTFTETFEIPMDVVGYGVGGRMRIDWPIMHNLPTDVEVYLVDTHTGTEVSLRNATSYDFDMDAAVAKRGAYPVGPHEIVSGSTRFKLVVEPNTSTSIETGTELPQGIALEQNYPNPFNPTTRISYTMPVSGTAHLAVYDLLGREVAVLVNGPVAAGSQFVNFDASALSSGVYMYRLTAGGQTLTRKMTLMK
jgi:hypothetical protein